jgi:hypothetical protein
VSTDPKQPPRALPDRPNLRHLKDQAKDLVKAGTATSITDAQFKIARLWISELAHAQSVCRVRRRDRTDETGSAPVNKSARQAFGR